MVNLGLDDQDLVGAGDVGGPVTGRCRPVPPQASGAIHLVTNTVGALNEAVAGAVTGNGVCRKQAREQQWLVHGMCVPVAHSVVHIYTRAKQQVMGMRSQLQQ